MTVGIALSMLARRAALVSLGLLMAGCSVFQGGGGSSRKEVTTGERIPVLAFEQTLEVDPQVASTPVQLPRPYINADWPQAGGYASKAMQHLTLGDKLSQVWSREIGKGETRYAKIIATPVMAEGLVYTMDSQAKVTAVSADDGSIAWSNQLQLGKKRRAIGFGGGLAVGGGRVYASTGFGFVAALDPRTGAQLWRKELPAPLRGAPAYADNRLFVITQDNQLFALSADKGEELWDALATAEPASLLGNATPAIANDTLVAGFSSGELIAYRVENGRTAWQDTLSRTSRLTALAALADIDGSPVIDQGQVIAIGHGGRIVALDLATGERVWEKSLPGVSTPWVAGNFVYVVTVDSEVVCLTRNDGKVRWIARLARYTDEEDRKGVIRWQGPVLASDRLIVTSSSGEVVTLSPYDGRLLSSEKLGDGSFLPPIVANGTLYVLTEDARLLAYR